MKRLIQKYLGKFFDRYIFTKVNSLLKKEYGDDWNDDVEGL